MKKFSYVIDGFRLPIIIVNRKYYTGLELLSIN